MKRPVSPPPLDRLLQDYGKDIPRIMTAPDPGYLHWDKLRHKTPPEGLNTETWWLGIKMTRLTGSKQIPLRDVGGIPFSFNLPDKVLAALHAIDSRTSGRIGLSAPVATEENRDRFVFNSLVEEAITSSQLEGASTTRQVAADMIRYQRKPRDHSERMILNNYRAMQSVREIYDAPISFESLMSLHRTLTEETLSNEKAAGRIQQPGEKRVDVVDHTTHRVLHTPPPAEGLREQVEALIAFANRTESAEPFIHPVVHAVILHFWLAYLHPFEDGNGRTARALFYWAMLHRGYWMFEFLSISRVIKHAPAKYARAFLHTETDDNDLTYFILHQLDVMETAIGELETYMERKVDQLAKVERLLKHSDLNHREIALLSHAIRHPDQEYSIKSHQTSHRVAYATARSDLLKLAGLGLLAQQRRGRKTLVFIAPHNLETRLEKL